MEAIKPPAQISVAQINRKAVQLLRPIVSCNDRSLFEMRSEKARTKPQSHWMQKALQKLNIRA